MNSKKVLFSGEGAKWEQLQGAPQGVMTAVIWGDSKSGPYGALTRFPPGFSAPLHTHSSEMRIVVIKGSYDYTPEGGEKHRYGPGSYVNYPAGDRHATKGDEHSESILFVEQPGKFDLNPV